ncbi:ABC transporter ATP-binding protein [Luteibacter sp. ME-Dv--P-043b]|uniref:ABC transporter ATP-binding protein n=1 Tax=unclassified Luteibacter TaxID=2620188 RepID=UPI002553C2AE|nr:ABC transporter ATP-binding protein [Luteibacter sp. ME-Dv--P-043b]
MSLDVQALRSSLAGPFDFHVPSGRCLAITGPSGSGKSLLLRMLADLDPCEGRVSLDAEDRATMSPTTWRRRVALLPARSGWWADRVDEHFASRQADERGALARDMLLADRLFDQPVDETSTGERQRLALIRALLTRPKVVLLDEPTASLDATATLAVEAVLRCRMQEGLIVVLVTHDAAQADRLGDDALVMRNGTLVRP